MADPKTPDAVTLLKANHEKVVGLFKDFEKANINGKKQKIADEILYGAYASHPHERHR